MSPLVTLMLASIAHPPVPIPAPTAVEIVGKVREQKGGSGPKNEALLTLDDGSEVVLHGRDESEDNELMRLAGVRVKVNGIKGDPLLPRGNHVRAFRYAIVDVGGGVAPRVGRIAEIELDGKGRLLFVDDEGRAETLPESFRPKLGQHVGAKVWVVGTAQKSELTPARFAILRPGPKSKEP
jgi:hypothetical protein